MVDGPASAQTMLNFGTWRSGYCLECCWEAYADNGARGDGSYATAYDAWLYGSGVKHEGDANPPVGVPVYWGVRSGSSAGDVCISWGDGLVVATDGAGIGNIGIMSITARGQQIGRPYLGWSESICGAPVQWPTTPGPQPNPQGGTMLLVKKGSNPEQIMLVSVDGGHLRLRYLEDPYEKAVFVATVPPLPITVCDDPTFDGFVARLGYSYGAPIPLVPVEAENVPPTRTRTRHELEVPAWTGAAALVVLAILGLVGALGLAGP